MAELNGGNLVFGGSTTLWYGVADSETIPASLKSLTAPGPLEKEGRSGFPGAAFFSFRSAQEDDPES